MKYNVVAIGNPFDGIALWGPFEDNEEAVEWVAKALKTIAEQNSGGSDWWIIELEDPKEWPIIKENEDEV